MVNGANLKNLQTEAEKVGFAFQNLLVWDKGNATPNKYYMGAIEHILMLSKRPARNINDMGCKNIIRIHNAIGNKQHPTEKPVELMKVFIQQSSVTGNTVFDPFAGVGGVLVAAKQLKRRFIGCDLCKAYCDIANSRLQLPPSISLAA
jgi:site-specific DNA-methyltransferase (adenine-specific)